MSNYSPATPRATPTQPIDNEALHLTLRALALLDASTTAVELSNVIRERFGVTTSTSRIYVAIGQLWERGHVTVEPVAVRRSGRASRQTMVTITARGRAAAATRRTTERA